MEDLDTVAEECDITPILKTGEKAEKENLTYISRNAHGANGDGAIFQ